MSELVPTIETERLLLRGWRNADLAPFSEAFGDAVHSRYIGGPLSSPLECWRRLVGFAGHWMLNGYGMFALEEKATGRFAGWCGPWYPVDFPETELSYTLHPAMQGRGMMHEAASAAKDWWFTRPGACTLVSYIHPDNARSVVVAKSMGATRVGPIELRGTTVGIWRYPPPAASATS